MAEDKKPQVRKYRVKVAKVWVNNALHKEGDIVEAAFTTFNPKTYEPVNMRPDPNKPSAADV